MKKHLLVILVLFVFIFTACDEVPESPTPQEGIPMPERTATEPPPTAEEPAEDPSAQGAEPGPQDMPARLLVIDGGGALWSKAVTDTEAVPVSGPDIMIQHPSWDALAVSGNYVAYTNKPVDSEYFEGYILTISDLSTTMMESRLPVLPPDFNQSADSEDPVKFASYTFMRNHLVPRWSPDGLTLAYAAMTHNYPMDVYTVSTEDFSVEQLTETPGYAMDPIWSPDGEMIYYFEAESFNPDLGSPLNRSVMGVRVSDKAIFRAEEIPGEGYDSWAGWLDDTTLLLYSADGCGPKDLRELDTQTNSVTMLFSGHFSHADYDPETGSILVGVGRVAPTCDLVNPLGMTLIKAGDDPVVVGDVEAYEVLWAGEIDRFIVKGSQEYETVLLVSTGGEVNDLPWGYPLKIDVSAGGIITWLMDDGVLWFGNETGPQSVIAEGVADFLWSADGQYLAVKTSDGIMGAFAPEFEVVPFFEGAEFVYAYGMTWAE